jgi:hypothetical protein
MLLPSSPLPRHAMITPQPSTAVLARPMASAMKLLDCSKTYGRLTFSQTSAKLGDQATDQGGRSLCSVAYRELTLAEK